MARDARIKAKAKALYEAGESARSISKSLQVARNTLAEWISSGAWEARKTEPKLIRKEQEALEAEAERHGITKAKVLTKLSELIDAQSVAVITTQGAVSLCPMLPGAKVSKDGKADFMGIQYDVVPDRKSQIEVTKLAADVLGMKKLDITSGGRSLLDEVLDEA